MNSPFQFATRVWYSFGAPALINGDFSGLDDTERTEVLDFITAVKAEFGDSADVVNVSDNSYFGAPDYKGLKGDVTNYRIMYQER